LPRLFTSGKHGGGEQVLNAGLGVVEITVDGDNVGVIAAGGGHLQLLHIANAIGGEEHRAAGAGHVLEALQGRLAGIAAGGHQDTHLALLAVFAGGEGGQVGQQLQRHILEGQRGTVEQLQHVGVIIQLAQGRHGGIVELGGGVGGLQSGVDLGNGEVLKEGAQDCRGTLAIVHISQLAQLLPGDLREHGGHIQSAVRGQTIEDRLRGSDARTAAGGEERHGDHPPEWVF